MSLPDPSKLRVVEDQSHSIGADTHVVIEYPSDDANEAAEVFGRMTVIGQLVTKFAAAKGWSRTPTISPMGIPAPAAVNAKGEDIVQLRLDNVVDAERLKTAAFRVAVPVTI